MTPSPDRRHRVYLDTSAYLCVLLGESGADRVFAQTDGCEIVSSVLLVLEARRNLIRLAREAVVSVDRYNQCMDQLETDTRSFALRDLTLDLCVSNQLPAIQTPRSLDLVHLRTALWFHAAEPLKRFVTMDDSQREAAHELGLPV